MHSSIAPISSGALPPVDQASLPPEVRDGSKEDKRVYQAALGFERVLMGELTRSMTCAAEASGDQESSSAATSAYEDMLSETLADSIASKGGIGLAAELCRSMRVEDR